MAPDALGHLEVWFVTGSQELYGPETLRQVEAHAREVAAALDGQPAFRCVSVAKPVATTPERSAACARRERGGHLHRRHRLDAHLLAGQDVDRRPAARCRSRCCTCTRSSTATCRGREIDMDFMNLNQSAHGDREFGFIETRLRLRRKIVVGHWQDPERRRRASAPGRGPPPAGTRRSSCRSSASATTCARSPSPRATRSRRRSGSGMSVNTYGVNDLVDVSTPVADAEVDALVAEYDERVRGRARAARGRRARAVAARRGAHRAGLRAFLERGRLRRLHRHLRGPRRPDAAARASPSSG